MVKKITEKYFLFKSIAGDYHSTDMNEIWDDIYDYISKTPYCDDYGEELIHISISHNGNVSPYLEVGFLFPEYIEPTEGIQTKEIKGGNYNVIKEKGICPVNGNSKERFHYRKHLDVFDETPLDCLNSEIYILLD